MVLNWKVGRPCRTTGNWMATRCGIYVVSMQRSRSILPDTTPSSIQDAKSTSLQCYRYLLADKGGNSCWWCIISCCKNCQQIDNLTCSWELQGTSLFCTIGIPRTTRWRLNNIVGSGPCKLGLARVSMRWTWPPSVVDILETVIGQVCAHAYFYKRSCLCFGFEDHVSDQCASLNYLWLVEFHWARIWLVGIIVINYVGSEVFIDEFTLEPF